MHKATSFRLNAKNFCCFHRCRPCTLLSTFTSLEIPLLLKKLYETFLYLIIARRDQKKAKSKSRRYFVRKISTTRKSLKAGKKGYVDLEFFPGSVQKTHRENCLLAVTDSLCRSHHKNSVRSVNSIIKLLD